MESIRFLNFVLYSLYVLNIYKDKKVFFRMKGDYSKIWELAQYVPNVFRARELFYEGDRREHLDQCILNHKGIITLYDSLSKEAREEIKDHMDEINKRFERAVEFYKEKFDI